MSDFFRAAKSGGIDLFVRLTPKSSRDAVDGIEQTADGRSHLAARVRAVPEKGAANTALERLLADVLSLPTRAVTVVGGGTSRLKTVHVDGHADAVLQALSSLGMGLKSG